MIETDEGINAFEAQLKQLGWPRSEETGRSAHLDEHGLWGCDEYGCDVFLGDGSEFREAYRWLSSATPLGHPAEFCR